MSSPCATCTQRCCHHYVVTVTGYDAWLIATRLHLALEQFLVTLPQSTDTAHGFRLQAGARTLDIALDKARARTAEKPCVFWLPFGDGLGRCGIYEHRPFVCQTYPATFSTTGVVRREDVLCPTEAWRSGELANPIWTRRLLAMQVEYDIYGLVVARWNYHVDRARRPENLSILAYYGYLMAFYDRLAPLRASIGASEWNRLCAEWAPHVVQRVSPLMEPVPELSPWSSVLESIRGVASSFFPSDFATNE